MNCVFIMFSPLCLICLAIIMSCFNNFVGIPPVMHFILVLKLWKNPDKRDYKNFHFIHSLWYPEQRGKRNGSCHKNFSLLSMTKTQCSCTTQHLAMHNHPNRQERGNINHVEMNAQERLPREDEYQRWRLNLLNQKWTFSRWERWTQAFCCFKTTASHNYVRCIHLL